MLPGVKFLRNISIMDFNRLTIKFRIMFTCFQIMINITLLKESQSNQELNYFMKLELGFCLNPVMQIILYTQHKRKSLLTRYVVSCVIQYQLTNLSHDIMGNNYKTIS